MPDTSLRVDLRSWRGLAWVAASLAAGPALAVSTVTVGTGAATPDGSYLNATNIAETLDFTNVSVTASAEVDFVGPQNLGYSSKFGLGYFDLTTTAPVTGISGVITWENNFYPDGSFVVESATVNLSGSLVAQNGGALVGASQLTGDAGTVNVLSDSANLQQALDLTQTHAAQSLINAAYGSSSSLTFNYDDSLLLSGGQLSGSVALVNPLAHLQLEGHGFELNTGSGYVDIGAGPILATSGELKGYLNSGDAFTVSFTQALPGQISAVPEPRAGWLLAAGLFAMGVSQRTMARRPRMAART